MEEYLETEEYTIETKEPIGPDIVCSACLSSDRDLYSLNNIEELSEIFQLLLYDFALGNTVAMSNDEQYLCWECQALMERFCKFKCQVHSAQEYIQGLANGSITKSLDHTYTSKCLSSLDVVYKTEYDRTYIDVSDIKEEHKISIISTKQPIPVELKPVLAPKMVLRNHVLPTIVSSNATPVKSEFFIGNRNPSVKSEIVNIKKQPVKSEIVNTEGTPLKSEIVIGTKPKTPCSRNIKVISSELVKPMLEKVDTHYIAEHMTEDDMYKSRELSKLQPQYLRAPYKCMLCIIGVGSQELLEEHFMTAHTSKPGQIACQICHKCIDESVLSAHTYDHYLRYMCKHCAHVEYSVQLMRRHVKTHSGSRQGSSRIKLKRKRNGSESSDMSEEFPIAGIKRVKDFYPCPECDMVFRLARIRRTHIDRHHREGIICDNCKRRFVNKTTLIEHLRLFCPVLHPGPPPQEECPICNKMVRVAYLKGHIRRHQNKTTYECKECNKTFSHYTNYKGHLKYSRVHATEFKYRCPMCEKGYSSKAIMQDHFNYQHLGKTSHKCPVCDKALASRRCVIQHMRRAHDKLDTEPNSCTHCGRGFKSMRRLREHTLIHTGERPLECRSCGATFRQASALYTHRRRLHSPEPAQRDSARLLHPT